MGPPLRNRFAPKTGRGKQRPFAGNIKTTRIPAGGNSGLTCRLYQFSLKTRKALEMRQQGKKLPKDNKKV